MLIPEAVEAAQKALSPDLVVESRVHPAASGPLAGHCYVASEAVYWLLGGPENRYGLKPHVMQVLTFAGGGTHWFLQAENGLVVDPTAGQFASFPRMLDYRKGRGCGFLTAGPSRRARVVLERVRASAAGWKVEVVGW